MVYIFRAFRSVEYFCMFHIFNNHYCGVNEHQQITEQQNNNRSVEIYQLGDLC